MYKLPGKTSGEYLSFYKYAELPYIIHVIYNSSNTCNMHVNKCLLAISRLTGYTTCTMYYLVLVVHCSVSWYIGSSICWL